MQPATDFAMFQMILIRCHGSAALRVRMVGGGWMGQVIEPQVMLRCVRENGVAGTIIQWTRSRVSEHFLAGRGGIDSVQNSPKGGTMTIGNGREGSRGPT